MLLKLFSVRDSKGEFFDRPFYKNTVGEAERDVRTAVNDPKSTLNLYPEDFDLYYLGEFDNVTGKIQPLDSPSHICKAVNLKEASH